MKRAWLCICVVMMLALAGCSGDGGKQLFETAQFEEKQMNRDHAVKLYEQTASQYPATEYGKKAAERLQALKGKP